MVKNLPANAGNIRDRFHPRVGKIPWRRAWQPTPVFLPGESPQTEEPGGLQSIGSQRVRHDWSSWVPPHTEPETMASRSRNRGRGQVPFQPMATSVYPWTNHSTSVGCSSFTCKTGISIPALHAWWNSWKYQIKSQKKYCLINCKLLIKCQIHYYNL